MIIKEIRPPLVQTVSRTRNVHRYYGTSVRTLYWQLSSPKFRGNGNAGLYRTNIRIDYWWRRRPCPREFSKLPSSGPSNSCISGTAVCRGHVKAACVNSLRYVALLPVLMTSWRPSAEWAVKASSSISSSTVAFEDDGTLELLTGVRDWEDRWAVVIVVIRLFW